MKRGKAANFEGRFRPHQLLLVHWSHFQIFFRPTWASKNSTVQSSVGCGLLLLMTHVYFFYLRKIKYGNWAPMTNVPVISYPCKQVCHRVFYIDFIFIAHLYKYQNVKMCSIKHWNLTIGRVTLCKVQKPSKSKQGLTL